MKIKIFVGLLLMSASASVMASSGTDNGNPLGKLSVHVTDEQGQGVAGATVRIWFAEQHTKQQAPAKGTTDIQGYYSAEGYSDIRLLSDANKVGYYESSSSGTVFKSIENGKWLPWDSTEEIVLRPIGQPVPLYARTGWLEIPAVDQACGYDLVKGDWVAPYGGGTTSDFIFRLERRYVTRQEFTVKVVLSFSQPSDGIQEARLPSIGRNSVFKWQRSAPESGYAPVLASQLSHVAGVGYETTALEDQAYFFRVRTLQKDGNIESALYGKIRGGIELAPSRSKTCRVKLTYYLNPRPLDRNLEWDMKSNLLSGLGFEQTPREP